jgi:hypothetical protein
MADVRPVGAVPRWVLGVFVATLAAQVALQALRGAGAAAQDELAPAPGAPALQLASFGEAPAAARLTMVYVQSHHTRDYTRLLAWLSSALELDPRGQYPLFLAARVYAETGDPARNRIALDFVYREFFRDPDQRWPWLAHAALLAKHRLKDLPLARSYARALERHVKAPDMPLWARQMEIFILEDMNELEAAKIMIASLLQSGTIQDPAELRFLAQRLEELEARMR